MVAAVGTLGFLPPRRVERSTVWMMGGYGQRQSRTGARRAAGRGERTGGSGCGDGPGPAPG